MEILMSNNRFDALIACIRCCVRSREYAGGVKYIQPLIFHRTHIETLNGNNHENIKIVFPTISLLIPFHGVFERHHAVPNLVYIVGFRKYL